MTSSESGARYGNSNKENVKPYSSVARDSNIQMPRDSNIHMPHPNRMSYSIPTRTSHCVNTFTAPYGCYPSQGCDSHQSPFATHQPFSSAPHYSSHNGFQSDCSSSLVAGTRHLPRRLAPHCCCVNGFPSGQFHHCSHMTGCLTQSAPHPPCIDGFKSGGRCDHFHFHIPLITSQHLYSRNQHTCQHPPPPPPPPPQAATNHPQSQYSFVEDQRPPHSNPSQLARGSNGSARTTESFKPQEQSSNNVYDEYWMQGEGTDHDITDFYYQYHTFALSEASIIFGSWTGRLYEDIRSCPLVIEIPKDGEVYSESFMKGKPEATSRWSIASTIYVIMPSPFQVGIARSLALSHGHFPLSNLIREMVNFSNHPTATKITVHYVGSFSNFSDKNLYIRNKNVKSFNLPWKEISMGLKNISKKNSDDKS